MIYSGLKEACGLVPLASNDGLCFLIREDLPECDEKSLALGFELACLEIGTSTEVRFVRAPTQTCRRVQMSFEERLQTSRPSAPDESSETDMLSSWLSSAHRFRPVLQLIENGIFESRGDFTRTLSAYGFQYQLDTLIYLPCSEVSRLLKEEIDLLRKCRCVVIQGLASASKSWPELIPFIAARAGFGLLTILLDEVRPAWMEHAEYKSMLRGATQVVRTPDDKDNEGAFQTKCEAEDDPWAMESERELISVAASVVARKFGVSETALFERRSDTATLKARQAAIYVARKWKRFEFDLIGSVLGERTAVSASQAYRRIEERYKKDSEFARLIDSALSDLEVWTQGLGQTS